MKRLGRGEEQQLKTALGEEGDFAVHASMYGKVQAEANANPNDQEGGKERGRCVSLTLAGLSSYLCRVCPMCVSLPRLGDGIHPTTIDVHNCLRS